MQGTAMLPTDAIGRNHPTDTVVALQDSKIENGWGNIEDLVSQSYTNSRDPVAWDGEEPRANYCRSILGTRN
jgi:hypothetical protein